MKEVIFELVSNHVEQHPTQSKEHDMTPCRMPHINQLAISGHIEGQPIRCDGYLELTVACRRLYRDKDGEWVEEINYIKAHVNAQPVESRAGIQDAPYPGPLVEGLPVFITGRIRSQPPEHTSLFLEARHVEVLKDRPPDDAETD